MINDYLLKPKAPLASHVTLAEAKLHLAIEASITVWDTLISGLILQAATYVESQTSRAFSQTTKTLYGSCFPFTGSVLIPVSPLVSVDSISYIDVNGDSQTMDPATYVVATREPPRIDPVTQWPETRGTGDAVTITMTVGYVGGEEPPTATSAILLLVGLWFANRSDASTAAVNQIPVGVDSLIDSIRVGDNYLPYSLG